MKVKFWGVRGSIPCPGPDTAEFGGNTSCIEIIGGKDIIVMDSGTGIRELGNALMALKKPVRVHILLTHTHWDHIQGFPFFTPIYIPGNELFIYGPKPLDTPLEKAMMVQMQYNYFPVRGVELAAKLNFRELEEESFDIDGVRISTKPMNHPIRVLAYRFEMNGKSGVYTGDNEPYYDVLADRSTQEDTGVRRRKAFVSDCNEGVVEFCKDLDMLIADAQYTDEEYEAKRGWGHSSTSHVLELARRSNVKKLVLFHHEPTHDDKEMARIDADARKRGAETEPKLDVVTAKEGMTLDV